MTTTMTKPADTESTDDNELPKKYLTRKRVAAGLGGFVLLSGVAFAAVTATSNDTASAAESTASASQSATATPTPAQKASNQAKYGMAVLPVSEAAIKQYKLTNEQLKDIATAKEFAQSSKAESVRMCESGGDYSINTGNGYYGAYQFDRPTWQANGGGEFSETANQAPKWAQDYIMWKTYQASGWAPWACA